MNVFVWLFVAYLAVGIAVTVFLSQTPYADNGWLWMTLLWPLYVYSFLSL